MTEIKDGAFWGCSGLKEVSISDGVTVIESSAFQDCSNMTSITIPGSVKEFGHATFRGCSNLETVNIEDLSAWCNIDFMGDENYSNPLSCGGKLYLNGQIVSNLVIPSDVISISRYAFYGYLNLNSVTIPNSVTSIGQGAFRGCQYATSAIIPSSVTEIGRGAFSGWGLGIEMEPDIYLYGVGDYYHSFGSCYGVKLHSYESKRNEITEYVDEYYFVPLTENVNITSLGLATFCADAGLDLTENTDIAAYKATVNGNRLELERVYTVTRGEGVLLRSLNGSTIKNVVNSEFVKNANEDNAFVGTLEDIVVAQTEGDNTNYVLSQMNGVTGFYIANNTKLSAGKAYLPVATSAAVKGFSISFSDDDATGIVEVATDESMEREGFYNLRGERVDRPENGIYIKGGKKVYFINK